MKAVVNLSDLRFYGMDLQHSGVRVRAGAGKACAVPLLVQLAQDAAILGKSALPSQRTGPLRLYRTSCSSSMSSSLPEILDSLKATAYDTVTSWFCVRHLF